jgi:hypothetical protein
MRRSSLALLAASIAVPALVLVPWGLFGDAVPRALVDALGRRGFARFLLAVGIGSLTLFTIATVRLVREARGSAEPRRAFRRLAIGAAAVVVLGLATAGAIFGYYAHEHDQATALCWPAQRASTVAERRKALEAAAKHRQRVAFFNESPYSCERLERELAELDQGICPEVVPADARCRCGNQRFPEDWPEPASPRCDAYDEQGNFAEDGKKLRRMRGH